MNIISTVTELGGSTHLDPTEPTILGLLIMISLYKSWKR